MFDYFPCFTYYTILSRFAIILITLIIGTWKILVTKLARANMTTIIENVQILQTLTSHTNDVTSVDFAGDCVLVTGSG